MDYKTKAINCVKDTALPVQMQWFKDCDYNLDQYCCKYGETEFFFAKIIEQGHVYEMGYPKCVCPEALSGEKEASFCECSRQGMIYVLENMMPEKHIEVETIETVLSGASKCRFKIVVE
ncbi:MAG: hypothetical protein GX567_10075 [Clostridia bacterium]|nr:hypothetical protein [Clostridia bacterium]